MKTDFLWVEDGSDAASSLEQWAQDYLRQHEKLGTVNEYAIRQATMRTITIKATSCIVMYNLGDGHRLAFVSDSDRHQNIYISMYILCRPSKLAET